MGLPEQFGFTETTDLDKGVIAVANDALGVGHGNELLFWREQKLFLGHGLVITHLAGLSSMVLTRIRTVYRLVPLLH
jgi:hypothetical protein